MSGIGYIVVVLFVLGLVGHCCYSLWKIRKHLHIFQLNSYFNRRYLNWLSGRKAQVFGIKELEPFLALLGILFRSPIVVLALFVLIYARLFLGRKIAPEKKPLVFTARATRLFIVNLLFLLILYFVVIVVWWYRGDFWLELAVAVLIAYDFLIPFFLLLANSILMPTERLIQCWYYRDASRYIKTLKDLKVIGVTGSFGKTTAKYVLAEILRQHFHVLKTPGSYNTTMGVTKIIRSELKPIHDVFVVEMGAKQRGDIREICALTHPKFGIITAIGEQHLESFGTLENIKKTKNELIESLPHDGVGFFNADDDNCRELASLAKCKVIRYGINSDALDYRVLDLTLNEHGSSFTVIRGRDNARATFQTRLLGRHNIYNILGAVAVAGELGIKLDGMTYAIRQLASVPHRLELKKFGQDIIFIDDAFNSNPVGSKMALEVLSQFGGRRKLIVTPGMVELGVKESEYNERFGSEIARVCDYVILVGKDQAVALQKGLRVHTYPDNQVFVAKDFAEAKKHLDSILQPHDVVLFENDLPDNYG